MNYVVPLIIRAATNITVEADGTKVSYSKGAPIDFHLDEDETPFLSVTEDEPDMSGSSRSIVSTVPSSGRVQTHDDVNPETRISLSSIAEIQSAMDALTGASISVRTKPDEPNALWVDKNVSANAMTVLSASGITSASLMGESVIKKRLVSTILAFTSSDLVEVFLGNIVFESELAPSYSYEELTPIDLLVREGISLDTVTSYIADNRGSVLKENITTRTLRVPVRRISQRMSTRERANSMLGMKENYEVGEKKVKEIRHIDVDKNVHMDSVGYFVVKSMMRAPVNEMEAISRVRYYLENLYSDKLSVISTTDNILRVALVKDLNKSDLIETMKAVNSSHCSTYGMVETSNNIFAISVRKSRDLTESSIYGKGPPKFLEDMGSASTDSPDITSSVGGDPDNDLSVGSSDIPPGTEVTLADGQHGTIMDAEGGNYSVAVGDGHVVTVPAGSVNSDVIARTPAPV